MSAMSDIQEIIRKSLHEAGEWGTDWQTCTQCEDAARALIKALSEAGFEIKPRSNIYKIKPLDTPFLDFFRQANS